MPPTKSRISSLTIKHSQLVVKPPSAIYFVKTKTFGLALASKQLPPSTQTTQSKMASPFPAPNRITVAHAAAPLTTNTGSHAEPGVEILEDGLDREVLFGGSIEKMVVATHATFSLSNDEPGRPEIVAAPGNGVVIPGGANIFYLDFAPGAQNPMHRTSSTDYVVVIKGTLTVLAPPPEPFDVTDDGKGSYAEMAETVAREGDIVVQRGSMHTWANRTDEWVRLLCVVLAADPAKVDGKEFEELWLQGN